jgi:hypothetical protein
MRHRQRKLLALEEARRARKPLRRPARRVPRAEDPGRELRAPRRHRRNGREIQSRHEKVGERGRQANWIAGGPLAADNSKASCSSLFFTLVFALRTQRTKGPRRNWVELSRLTLKNMIFLR